MELCDAALGEVLSTLGVEVVVGIGKFAEYRVRETVKRRAQNVIVSMKTPLANTKKRHNAFPLGWMHAAPEPNKPSSEQGLERRGLEVLGRNEYFAYC